MSSIDDFNPDDLLERFLDDSLDASEREAFEDRLRAEGTHRAEVELQGRVDAALIRLFPTGESTNDNGPTTQLVRRTDEATIPRRRTRLALWSAVAAAAVLLTATYFWGDSATRPEPFFQPASVATLYLQTVANGFEPYYECRDDERFTAVFAKRQKAAVRLLPMPSGSRMLGLSYPGGLSRDTTAMLCEVDQQPLMVFVDRLEADQPIAADNPEPSRLFVHRVARDELVFYEVSPWDDIRAIPFLSVD